ncbi:MAG: uracil-DNA glycosylase [Thermoplasmata archaeon]
MESIYELNRKIKGCEKCQLQDTSNNRLLGEGNRDARVMLIAQAPGEKENKVGRMFIGPSGKVLDNLLKNAGVSREEIYMTNLIKCMLPGYRKPKQNEIDACSEYLDEEIRFVNPAILVPMGYYATRYIFNKYSLKFEGDFPRVIGKLFLVHDIKVYPLPHPASLLYDDSHKEEMFADYNKLKIFLSVCKWYPLCPMKRFYEEAKIERKWVELYCKGDWKSCVRFQKVEKSEPHPASMLPNGEIMEEMWETFYYLREKLFK